MKPIDSENVIAWLNAQIEKMQGGWLHDYGFPTNVIAALTETKRFVKNLPTAEPEVRNGRWKKKNGEIYCTNCKKSKWSESFELMLRRFNFCPNCGAKMDGGDDK